MSPTDVKMFTELNQNAAEDLAALPAKLLRWKILQALPGESFHPEIYQTLSDKICCPIDSSDMGV